MESPEASQDQSQHTVKLFVGGLTGDMTKEMLAEYFGRLVEVADSFVVYEHGKPSGFGFITTKDREDAQKILSTKHTLNNSLLDVKPALDRVQARDKEESDRRRKIFVGGLPKNFPDEKLSEYFGQFGPIQKSYVVKDPMTGKTRGFGFVIFSTQEGYTSALEHPNVIIGGSEAHIKPAMAKQDEKESPKISERMNSPNSKKGKKPRASQHPESKTSQNRSRPNKADSPTTKNRGVQYHDSKYQAQTDERWYSEQYPAPVQSHYDYAWPSYYMSPPISVQSPTYPPNVGYYAPHFQYPVQQAPVFYSPQPVQAIGAPVQSLNRIQLYPVTNRPAFNGTQMHPQQYRPASAIPVMIRPMHSTQAIINRDAVGSSRFAPQGPLAANQHTATVARSAHAIGVHPRTFSQFETDRGKFIPKTQPPRYESSPFTPQDDEEDAPHNELSRAKDF